MVLADAVKGCDVGVIERSRRLRFPDQASFDFLFAEHLAGEELQCDDAFEIEVFGFPDLAHRALAELLEDLIVADRAPRHNAQIVLWRLAVGNKRSLE